MAAMTFLSYLHSSATVVAGRPAGSALKAAMAWRHTRVGSTLSYLSPCSGMHRHSTPSSNLKATKRHVVASRYRCDDSGRDAGRAQAGHAAHRSSTLTPRSSARSDMRNREVSHSMYPSSALRES